MSAGHTLLLTGAGFSRNWGGWLAKEIEGDLLGRLADHPELRHRVQSGDGFESIWDAADLESRTGNLDATSRYQELQHAIYASFRAMNLALANRADFNFSNDRHYSVNGFLARFDAIYTLNQDLLLELHYDPSLEDTRHPRWNARFFPGVASTPAGGSFKVDLVDQKRHVKDRPEMALGCQPIYKLHGSTNWQDQSGDLFVVGGSKASFIERKPILKAYFDDFAHRLRQPDTRLMIIGYGFADEHVNQAMLEARTDNPSLSVYFVHPEGRDAIYRGVRKEDRVLPQHLPPLARLSCIGESRRPLSSTFAGDQLEFDKLMRFFACARLP
jgi:SIR2-like domain